MYNNHCHLVTTQLQLINIIIIIIIIIIIPKRKRWECLRRGSRGKYTYTQKRSRSTKLTLLQKSNFCTNKFNSTRIVKWASFWKLRCKTCSELSFLYGVGSTHRCTHLEILVRFLTCVVWERGSVDSRPGHDYCGFPQFLNEHFWDSTLHDMQSHLSAFWSIYR